MLVHFDPLVPLAAMGLLASLILPHACASKNSRPTVIVYTSQDQIHAEKIFTEFSRATGITVRPVFDSEAVKTVGLANRLLAERPRPQCDVFWSNEEMRTRQLAAQDCFRATNGWAAFGFRSRRIVINTNFVVERRSPDRHAGDTSQQRAAAEIRAPTSLLELTNEIWRGKVALAYPLFGTTATHFQALRQQWGDARWQRWCRALQANRPFLVDGNSVAAKLVATGQAWIGLTDADDIAAEQAEGAPIVALPLTAESLLIPNTVAVIRHAPHPAAAQQLFEFLQQPATVAQLVAAGAIEGATAHDRTATLQPAWDDLLRDLEPATKTAKEIFLR